MDQNTKAIIFDVDGTLTDGVSWEKLTEGVGADVEKLLFLYREMKEGRMTYPDAKKDLIALWRSTGNANKTFLASLFDTWPVKADAADVIRYLQSKYHVCLISGTVDLYIGTVAKKLSVSDWFANTTLIWDSEDTLIDFDYTLDQASKKVEQFKTFCALNGYSAEECVCVGDGENDIQLFKATKGIYIKGFYPGLEDFAWKKIERLSELKTIL